MAEGVNVEVTLISRIPQLMAHVESGSRAAVLKVAQNIADKAKGLAPVASGFPGAGTLRDSIHAESVTSGKVAEVHVDAPFAGYVEFGTYKAPAQPFLGPACADEADELGAEMTTLIEGFGGL